MFAGQKILTVNGNSKIDQTRIVGKKVIAIKTWGKHFLLCFKDFTVRVHLLMFGSYSINEQKDKQLRLGLTFKNGTLNLYNCAIKILEGPVDDNYDFTADVMNDTWDAKQARAKLKEIPDKLICDALLEQDIFSGVGNIIKNEVLFGLRVHPKSLTGKIPSPKLRKLVDEARNYSFDFLEWKRNFVLKQHWLAHTKKICSRCELPIIKEYTGEKKRRSFFCVNCQKLYK